MALKRNQQIFLREETTEGAPFANVTDVVNSTYGKFRAIDPTIEFEPQKIERSIAQGTLTPSLGISGQKLATMRFGLEITGNGTAYANGVAQFDLPLRACGFRREVLSKCLIGAITVADKFIHGEQVIVSGTPATIIGVVVKNTYDGEPALYLARQNGLGTTVSITSGTILEGLSSGAKATLSADSTQQAAFGYWPVSYSLSKLDVQTCTSALAVGDIIQGATSGAVAVVDVAQTASPASPVSLYVRMIGGTFGDAETVARVSPTAGAIGLTDASNAESQFTNPTIAGAVTKDGVYEAASNMRGNVTIRLPVGDLPVMQFELKGAYLGHEDGSNITGISYPQLVPAPVLAAAFKIGANNAADTGDFVSPCVATIEIQTGNELTQRQCMNSDAGVYAYEITARSATCTLDPELQPEAFFPVMSKFLDNETVCMEVRVQPVLEADRDGRTFIIQIPCAGISASTTTDRNGRLVRSLTLAPNTGSSSTSTPAHDNDIVIIHDLAVDTSTGV